jgi:hypothetical protein
VIKDPRETLLSPAWRIFILLKETTVHHWTSTRMASLKCFPVMILLLLFVLLGLLQSSDSLVRNDWVGFITEIIH